MSNIIYLASPYSHDDVLVRYGRFLAVCKTAACLIKKGFMVFSPIAHSNNIAVHGGLPTGFDGWRKFDLEMLGSCGELFVLAIPGWKESKGVEAEMQYAKDLGKPIRFVNEQGEFIEAT